MKAHKILLMITAGAIASSANARERKSDIDIQIKNTAPRLAVSLDQSQFLIRNRQFGLAVDALRKIIRVDPENDRAYSAIAIAYDGLGRPDLARKYFELALAHAPLEKRHYRNLARHMNDIGETALARDVMQDFEIAQSQIAAGNPSWELEPTRIVETLANSLDNETLSEKTNFPQKQPNAPKGTDLALIPHNNKSPTKIAATLEPLSTGKGGADGFAHNAKSSDADKTRSIAEGTAPDLEGVIAEIYAGLGIAMSEPELVTGYSDDRILEDGSQINQKGTVHYQKPSFQNPAVTHVDTGSATLSWQQLAPSPKNHPAHMVELQSVKISGNNPKTGRFRLVRKSLSEVLLTTSNSDWQSPVRTAILASDKEQRQGRIETGQNDASHYFRAVRSLLDEKKDKLAAMSSDILTNLAMKQLDLAMTDFMQKRLQRIARIDRGPSVQMQKIASVLYRDVNAHQTIPLMPVKQNVQVALFYRKGSSCAA